MRAGGPRLCTEYDWGQRVLKVVKEHVVHFGDSSAYGLRKTKNLSPGMTERSKKPVA